MPAAVNATSNCVLVGQLVRPRLRLRKKAAYFMSVRIRTTDGMDSPRLVCATLAYRSSFEVGLVASGSARSLSLE